MTGDLLSYVLEKFNGYEIIKQKLARKEKVDFTPLDIVYKPTYDENIPIPCLFINQIHLAYRSYLGQFTKREEKIIHRTVKQCHYCENVFVKTDEATKKHLSVCAAKGGITYAFDNGQIVNFQDNFKYLGDMPFTVYFDFETTTGNSAFSEPKMYVISYCQIYTFHPSLNLDKIVIFRSFQQKPDEIYDLSHFKKEHKLFFNRKAFYQLKDAADAVLAREKATSLAELFSVELKFTVDTLNEWFSTNIKPKFLEVDSIRKQICRKENPIDRQKTVCSVCGFLLCVNSGGWIDFVVKWEHLFLKNILLMSLKNEHRK